MGLLVGLLFPFLCSAQDSVFTQSHIIQGLTEYRNAVINRDEEAVEQLRALEQRWDVTGSNREIFESLLLNVLSTKAVYDFPEKTVLRITKRECPQCARLGEITEADIRVLEANSELLNLVLEGILKPEYPFGINPDASFFEELDFFQLKSGQAIAEIGAGNGVFSLLLTVLGKDNRIDVNELKRGFLAYFLQTAEANRSLMDGIQFHAIKGKKTDTGLDLETYDRIVIRNAFHHFSKKEAMLKSIKRALKPDGKLCLYEPITKTQSDLPTFCDLVMDKSEMLQIIQGMGFNLEETSDLEGMTLMRFSIKK
ncbi:MAG: class I SAM-dependent methyltransferase [Saprospiraceae bacterium]